MAPAHLQVPFMQTICLHPGSGFSADQTVPDVRTVIIGYGGHMSWVSSDSLDFKYSVPLRTSCQIIYPNF